MPQLLTSTLNPNITINSNYVTWDLSVNNLDVSLNVQTSSLIPSSNGGSRSDVPYNFTIVNIAANATARGIYYPTPYSGQVCLLTNNNTSPYSLSLYSGATSSWIQIANGFNYLIKSSGGTEYLPVPTYFDVDGSTIISYPLSGGYTMFSFTALQATTTYTFIPYFNKNVQYLVVAGGGGGGEGGGGAGGLLSGTLPVINGTAYTIYVGAGGLGCYAGYNQGPGVAGTATNGGNSAFASAFASFVAIGGGYGGAQGNGTTPATGGGNGGSGGGGRRDNGPGGGSGTPGQGNNGGTTPGSPYRGGSGGGGAGSVGGNGSGGANTSEAGGVGGNGLPNSITGTSIYYAGGGGGGIEPPQAYATGGGYGGLGGGGRGGKNVNSTPSLFPTSGVNGLGGGGGGIAQVSAGANYAGNGGSGVVIIKFLT